MGLSIESTILLFGIIQGAVLMLVAWNSKGNSTLSNRLFAGIILILCFTTLDSILFEFLDWGHLSRIRRTFFNSLPLELILLLGPLIFFYLQSLFDRSFKITRKHLVHFLPVVLEIIPFVFSILFVSFRHTLVGGANDMNYHFLIDRYGTYIALPEFLSLSIYLIKSWKYLSRAGSGADQKTLKWGRDLLIGFTLVTIVWFPFLIVSVTSFQSQLLELLYYYPIYYPVVGLLFFISIRLMLSNMSFRPNLYSQYELEEKAAQMNMLILDRELYSNSDLTLLHLSNETGIPSKSISFILNHYLKKGFSEYINEYRVNAALVKIKNKELTHMTLEGIGLGVGFRSRSTFYRSFKQVTGLDPSAYIRQNK